MVVAVSLASTATQRAPPTRSATEVAAPTRSLRDSTAPSMRTASPISAPAATAMGFREASSGSSIRGCASYAITIPCWPRRCRPTLRRCRGGRAVASQHRSLPGAPNRGIVVNIAGRSRCSPGLVAEPARGAALDLAAVGAEFWLQDAVQARPAIRRATALAGNVASRQRTRGLGDLVQPRWPPRGHRNGPCQRCLGDLRRSRRVRAAAWTGLGQ
jgi:hypothetical protein